MARTNYAVLVGDYIFAITETREEANATIEGMRMHNRWWREGCGSVHVKGTNGSVTNPLERRWSVQWVPGRAGWDSMPLDMRGPFHEQVRHNSSSEQQVHVMAPTAYLAELRAKFMLMEQGKEKG